MTEYTLTDLKKVYKELSAMGKLIPEMHTKFITYAAEFHELISCVLSEHVAHYVNEFFLKVSVIMNVLDTLEFGRLRSANLLLSHHKYIYDGKSGSYAKPNKFEAGLKLTICSIDGINYCLNKHFPKVRLI